MGQPISTMDCAALSDQFRDARLMIANEFRALDTHDQYYNAFARLLKRDPLGRVAMLGTDQRDRFVPAVRAVLAGEGDAPRHILDVGCGDGQTFALIADPIAGGSTIDLVDPNEDYVAAYVDRLAGMANVATGQAHARPFVPDAEGRFYTPPLGIGYDLIFAIHALYFFEDLEACLADLGARLAPGGTAIIVFADESVSYTGVCYRAYLRQIDRADLAEAHAALCAQRLALLRGSAHAGPTIAELWRRGDGLPSVRVLPQPTRLFGHTLADLIALSNIAGLSLYDDPAKFEAAGAILETDPASVALEVETDPDSPRYGMFSVSQPQIVCAITMPV